MEVSEVTDLKPVVEKTIKTLYGEGVQNIKIFKADQYPIFGAKEWWLVNVEFNDDKFRYWIDMHVQTVDGKVTKLEEKQRVSSSK